MFFLPVAYCNTKTLLYMPISNFSFNFHKTALIFSSISYKDINFSYLELFWRNQKFCKAGFWLPTLQGKFFGFNRENYLYMRWGGSFFVMPWVWPSQRIFYVTFKDKLYFFIVNASVSANWKGSVKMIFCNIINYQACLRVIFVI